MAFSWLSPNMLWCLTLVFKMLNVSPNLNETWTSSDLRVVAFSWSFHAPRPLKTLKNFRLKETAYLQFKTDYFHKNKNKNKKTQVTISHAIISYAMCSTHDKFGIRIKVSCSKSKSFASQARRIAWVFKTLGYDEVKIFKTSSNYTYVNSSWGLFVITTW